MYNRQGDIYSLISLYESYLYNTFGYDRDIVIIDYSNEQMIYHTWEIEPICIGNSTFTRINLSDSATGDMLLATNSMSLFQALELNLEIIKISLK